MTMAGFLDCERRVAPHDHIRAEESSKQSVPVVDQISVKCKDVLVSPFCSAPALDGMLLQMQN